MRSQSRKWILMCFVGIVIITIVWPHGIRAQYVNIRVDQNASNANEVTIAINPRNPDNIVAAANIRYYYASLNGGQGFVQSQLKSTFGNYGDPSLIFGKSGECLIATLSGVDDIICQRSIDGGFSYNNGSIGNFNRNSQQDKEWLAADLSNGPYSGRVYVAFGEYHKTNSALDTSHILLSYSDDDGDSWSTPVGVSIDSTEDYRKDLFLNGAMPAVGPSGEVYVVWSGPKGVLFDRSFDGGKTFEQNQNLTDTSSNRLTIPGIYRSNGYPIIAVDQSHTKTRGNVYVVWADQSNGKDNTDIFLRMSTDSGATWTPRQRVNSDAGHHQQFFPWVTVDPIMGHVLIVYYDRRNSIKDTLQSEIYMSESVDGGKTFRDFRISSVPFHSTSTFIGDYIGIAAYNRRVYPIWTRVDNNATSVWIAMVQDTMHEDTVKHDSTLTVSVAEKIEESRPLSLKTIGAGESAILLTLDESAEIELMLYDVLGRKVMSVAEGNYSTGIYQFPLKQNELPHGVYFAKLTERLESGGRKENAIKISY